MFSVSYEEMITTILLKIITAAQNRVVLSHRRVRGLYFLAVIFAVIIYVTSV